MFILKWFNLGVHVSCYSKSFSLKLELLVPWHAPWQSRLIYYLHEPQVCLVWNARRLHPLTDGLGGCVNKGSLPLVAKGTRLSESEQINYVFRQCRIKTYFLRRLKLKRAIKFKKYFDQHCYVARFEILLSVRLQAPLPTPSIYKPPLKPLTKLYEPRAYSGRLRYVHWDPLHRNS